MKEPKENIDQLFKSKLEEQSFEIPAAYISNLESMLPPEKKNGKYFWWFSLSVAILSLSAWGYYALFSSVNTSDVAYSANASQNFLIDSIKVGSAGNVFMKTQDGDSPAKMNVDVTVNDNLNNNETLANGSGTTAGNNKNRKRIVHLLMVN